MEPMLETLEEELFLEPLLETLEEEQSTEPLLDTLERSFPWNLCWRH